MFFTDLLSPIEKDFCASFLTIINSMFSLKIHILKPIHTLYPHGCGKHIFGKNSCNPLISRAMRFCKDFCHKNNKNLWIN